MNQATKNNFLKMRIGKNSEFSFCILSILALKILVCASKCSILFWLSDYFISCHYYNSVNKIESEILLTYHWLYENRYMEKLYFFANATILFVHNKH